MNHKAVLFLTCLTLMVTVQAVASIQNFDCTPGVVQNFSPKGMGGLQTSLVFNGSLIQLDGTQWRDAVTGSIPTTRFPGISTANVTTGSHILKISLPGYQDFAGNVTVCDQGITEVTVQQESIGSATEVSGTTPGVFPSAPSRTVPVPPKTTTPGFELFPGITAVAAIWVVRKYSFR